MSDVHNILYTYIYTHTGYPYGLKLCTDFGHIILQRDPITNCCFVIPDTDQAGGSSEEDQLSGGEIEVVDSMQMITEEDRELKDKLLRKYSGYISTLKHEFSKKKKKGKLPKEARQILLDWWTMHYRWPYPTVYIPYIYIYIYLYFMYRLYIF